MLPSFASRPPLIYGNSSGSQVVAELAATRPERRACSRADGSRSSPETRALPFRDPHRLAGLLADRAAEGV
jgi:hypothetical protein